MSVHDTNIINHSRSYEQTWITNKLKCTLWKLIVYWIW